MITIINRCKYINVCVTLTFLIMLNLQSDEILLYNIKMLLKLTANFCVCLLVVCHFGNANKTLDT